MKYFIIMIVILGCHPVDKRLNIYNKTNKSLIIKMIFDIESYKDSINSFRTEPFKVLPKKKENFILFNSKWNKEFEDFSPDSLNIIVYNDFNLEIKDSKQDYYRRDSLFKVNQIAYKKYSLKELIKNKWLITYPDDEFIEY